MENDVEVPPVGTTIVAGRPIPDIVVTYVIVERVDCATVVVDFVVDWEMYPGGHTVTDDDEVVEVLVELVDEVVVIGCTYVKYAVSVMLLFICTVALGEFPV